MNATRPSRGPPSAVTAAPFVGLRTRLTAELERVLATGVRPRSVHDVPCQRARHAVASAAAAAQLGTDDGDHLDAGPAQQGVGVGVAVIGEDHPGFDGNEVVAAVPLLAFGVVGRSTGLHYPQRAEAQRGGYHLD